MSVKTDDNHIYDEDGSVLQVVEDRNFLVTAEGLSIDDEIGAVMLSIGNKGRRPYYLEDGSITIYGGNVDRNKWRKISTWSASRYMRNVEEIVHDQESFASIMGTIGIIASFTDMFTSSDLEVEHAFDLGDAIFTSFFISSALDEMARENAMNLDFLRSSLLQSGDIRANGVKRGLVYFTPDGYPDYLVRVELDGRNYDLVFSRSDREYYL